MRLSLHLIILCSLLSFNPLFSQKVELACIGFYNVENLFDTLDTPDKFDEDFTPAGQYNYNSAIYWDKQDRLAEVISKMGSETPDGPAVLGVAEVENRAVLEDLVKREAIKARNYQIVHYESPDERGIDVALLYNPRYFKVTASKPIKMSPANPDGSVNNTRDILLVSGLFKGESFHFMVNHWPSRRGGEASTSPMREQCAAECKRLSDSIQLADPKAKVVVMGDLNDDPINKSMTEKLQANGKAAKVADKGFFNPWMDFFKKGDGTMAYQDAWSLFDQIVISKSMLEDKSGNFYYYGAKILKEPFMYQTTGQYKGYPLRTFSGNEYLYGYSDHFPTYIYIIRKKP